MLLKFESIVRRAPSFTEARSEPIGGTHPFDERNIHNKIHVISKKLFDDGYYWAATLEACKMLDKEVAALAQSTETGKKLMMNAFNLNSPVIRLTNLSSPSEKDEQEGYMFLFSGSVLAIRNPRSHEYAMIDTLTECLDHLSLASMLLRRLEHYIV